MKYYLFFARLIFPIQLHSRSFPHAVPRQINFSALILAFLGLLLISRAFGSDALADTPKSPFADATSTFLVALDENLTEEERAELLQDYNAELVHWMPEVNLAEIRFGTSPQTPSHPDALGEHQRSNASYYAGLAAIMANEPAIEFMEANRLVHGTSHHYTQKILPDDPELQNSTNGYAQQLLEMESAWGQTMGSESVVIAVLDTGVDATHPELDGQLVPGYDFINNSSSVSDDNGHGTHVSGIIASRINNSQGSAGICPRCKVMPIKVLDQNNVGVWSVIVQGILFAVDNGAQIINLSLGSSDQSNAVQRAVEYAQENGVLLIAAAGNSRSRELFFPAAYAGVLSVSATDRDDREWSLSNQGTYIDVAAPGYLIYSTSIGTEKYGYMTGTSMAAPFVSGLAGLLLSQSPYQSAADLSDRIIHNAVDLGTPGWDSTFGFGRVNAYAALTAGDSHHAELPNGTGSRLPVVYLPLVEQ